MEEGVKGSRAFIAVVTGPCVNPDAPDEEPIANAYFKREYCIKVRAKLRSRVVGCAARVVCWGEGGGGFLGSVEKAPHAKHHTQRLARARSTAHTWRAPRFRS